VPAPVRVTGEYTGGRSSLARRFAKPVGVRPATGGGSTSPAVMTLRPPDHAHYRGEPDAVRGFAARGHGARQAPDRLPLSAHVEP